MLMRRLSRLALPVSLAIAFPAVVPLVACGGGVASEQPASAETATTRAPLAQSAHGPVKLVGAALGDVPLTATQRTQIEKLAGEAEARHTAARAARQDLMLAVASQVQSGAVDRPALQPKIDALAAALKQAQPADRSSLEQLHAILSADQRTAFVDALEARIGEAKGKMHAGHPLKQWADDLKLTEDQRTQIRTALRDRFHAAGHGETAAHGESAANGETNEHPWAAGDHPGAKVLSAFKQDRFVMDEVAPARDLAHTAAQMSDHFLGLAETVLPILTPDQRAIAAAKIREKASGEAELGPAL
jgi:Spy/CpxP family protein refolding chaperone